MWWIVFPLLAAVVFLGALYAYCRAFFSYKKEYNYRAIPIGEEYKAEKEHIRNLIDDIVGIAPTKTFKILAYDRTWLYARYYHVCDNAPLHIQFHGYRSSGYRDFCSGTKLAKEVGYNILVVDQRAHGKSGGRSITFGIRERYDCRIWTEFAGKVFGKKTPIFLSGVSMGAATVLMASELPMGANVVGILADCPYSSPEAIIKKVCAQDMKLPVKLMYPFVQLGALLFGHFRIRGGAVKAVENTRIPLCIFHGEADQFVPCDMSREIAAHATGRCQLHTFPGAGHGLSYIVDEPRYREILKKFSKDCLEHPWNV